jgi:glycosyltransferase involved in cell wall biosynthesis
MSVPFISFISTAYRTEQYVPGMIDSVLAQTDPDWELVIVDNGNADSMAEVVQPYLSDPRIRLVRQENRGVIGGFAAATDAAVGEYVAPMSSDDQVVPEYVARMRETVAEHPDALGVTCDAHLFSDSHEASYQRGLARSVGGRPAKPPGEWLTKRELLSGRIPYYGGVYRRTAWNEAGGFSTRDDSVDEVIELLMRLTDFGPVFVIPDRLGRYRLRDDSLTRDGATVEAFERRLINTYRVYGGQATDPKDQAAAKKTIDRLVYMQSIRRAREAFAVGDIPVAREESKTALRHGHTPRAIGITVMLHVSPRLLTMVHPAKRRATDWMLIHSPVDWIRTHLMHGSARAISRSAPGAAPPGSQPVEEQRGLPPTSP